MSSGCGIKRGPFSFSFEASVTLKNQPRKSTADQASEHRNTDHFQAII
jgi:hypothetical protein